MRINEAKAHVLNLMAEGSPEATKDARAAVWYGLARLAVGRDREGAIRLLESGLVEPNMFTVPGYIRALIRHRTEIPDALAERIATMLTEGTSYGGLYDSIHTENHKVMLATTRLLVAQTLADRRIERTRASVAYQASLDWLRWWGATRCVYGHPEFHSPVYSMTYTMPLLNLRDCTSDPRVRRMAEMMTDYIAVHHAVNHLDGTYAGGHSRTYDQTIVHTKRHPSQLWSFLYYGAKRIEYEQALWLLFSAADSDYVPHPAIIAAALRRDAPFLARERHAEVVSNGVPVDIQRLTWMTDAFSLSSLQGASWPDHQLRWSLKIAGRNPHAIVFTNHPGKSEKWGTWHGASEYEHLLQHEGAIIVSYNIPARDPHLHVYAHLPEHADVWSPEPETLGGETAPRWLFLRIAGAFVALYPLAPFHIERANYEGPLLEGAGFTGQPYWRIALAHRVCGLVLEASTASRWASFDEFVSAAGKSRPELLNGGSAVRYRTLGGATLELTNPGPDPGAPSWVQPDGTVPVAATHLHYRAQRPNATFAIDGASPDYVDWPSLDCPFARSEFGSGVMRAEWDGHGVELDFRKWEKRVW